MEFTISVAQLRERLKAIERYLSTVNQETPVVVKARGEVSNLHALTLTPRHAEYQEDGSIVLDHTKVANTLILFVE